MEESSLQSLDVFEQSLLEPTVARDVQERLDSWIKDRTAELLMQNLHSCYEFAEQMLG